MDLVLVLKLPDKHTAILSYLDLRAIDAALTSNGYGSTTEDNAI